MTRSVAHVLEAERCAQDARRVERAGRDPDPYIDRALVHAVLALGARADDALAKCLTITTRRTHQ